MDNLTCILIDDEISGRVVLRELLALYYPDILILGEASGVQEAYDQVTACQPDFILLDIHMPGGGGFGLLRRFSRINFEVIFVTSYDQYAMEAIKARALDYLLKPVEVADLKHAVEKVKEKKESGLPHNRIVINLLSDQGAPAEKNITVHHLDRVKFFHLPEINCFEAEGNYTRICIAKNESYMTPRTLKEFEDFLLNHADFVRINRSVIVNVRCISEYSKGNPCILYLSNGCEYEVSRRKKAEISARIRTDHL
jgi:two-component system LytT family response regulator